ncbi:DUF58 domain-containing protein [Desulfonatronum thioautotrophicum]|uniref:DUF58 domain-containing protein n=1 Tax=Desulfonatronum thioautotrophicum TaxID=617001 RepID=UPI0005EB4F09|nr:DUF58 domain-containing protein [Desulfonatronum thioautotrophicum]
MPPDHTTHPVELGIQRIYILPSKTGAAYAILLVILLLISINYNNPPGYLLTFLLTGLGLVSLFHTHRGLSGLLVNHVPSTPVFAGDRAQFPIIVANPGRRHRYAIQAGWTRTGDAPLMDIPPMAEATFHLGLQTKTRGELRPKRVVVTTIFPLGLFRAWSWVELPLRCLVYPTPAPAALPVPVTAASGSAVSPAQRKDGDEFDGLRTYQPGDSLRRIAWKAVARRTELISKDYAGAAESREILLDWDDLPEEDVEVRLAQLCRLVLDAEAAGNIYSLRVPGQRIIAGSGLRHLHACLTLLALFPAPSRGSP